MQEPIWLREDSLQFPPSHLALKDPNGLLAVGGDLSPARLIEAYSNGIFPWFDDHQPILWWTPEPRMIFYPGQVKQSKSLKKHLRQQAISVTLDQDFAAVIDACSQQPRPGQQGTWITDDMRLAYLELHNEGVAHSVETRDHENKLIGGLYGVAIGGVFFGESMFSRATNASKIAITVFSDWLAKKGFGLIDCQVENPHLISLGGQCVSREAFEKMLSKHAKAREQEFKSFWPNHAGEALYYSPKHPLSTGAIKNNANRQAVSKSK